MDGSVARGSANQTGIRAEVDGINCSSLSSSAEFGQEFSGFRVKDPDQSTFVRGCGQTSSLDVELNTRQPKR